MSEKMARTLQTLGVTPWQFLLGAVCVGSWWATVQPLPGALEKLNTTVQNLSAKVEVHGVLLDQVKEVKLEVRTLNSQVATISGKLAHVPGYPSKRTTTETINEP